MEMTKNENRIHKRKSKKQLLREKYNKLNLFER